MVGKISFDYTNLNHVQNQSHIEILGDTVAQVHLLPPTTEMKNKITTEVVKMANRSVYANH